MTGNSRIKLLENLYDIYLKDLLSQRYCACVKLYGIGQIQTENSVLKDIYVDSVILPNDKSRNNLCSKLYLAINDFLQNTGADWFVRLCDDTFVNMRSLGAFLDDLNKQNDPSNDRLIQGNCIHKYDKRNTYLQGGSGMIFSRFSALELNQTFDFLRNRCNIVKNDDSALGVWLIQRNYSLHNITSRFFVGHRFIGFKKLLDITANNSKIEDCASKLNMLSRYYKFCRPFTTNFRNIVFWHDRVHFMEFLPFARKFIDEMPDNLYFYQDFVKPKVCRSAENIDRYRN